MDMTLHGPAPVCKAPKNLTDNSGRHQSHTMGKDAMVKLRTAHVCVTWRCAVTNGKDAVVKHHPAPRLLLHTSNTFQEVRTTFGAVTNEAAPRFFCLSEIRTTSSVVNHATAPRIYQPSSRLYHFSVPKRKSRICTFQWSVPLSVRTSATIQ